MILEFSTEDCFWCRKLEETTLHNAAVSRLIASKFVPLKVDAQRNAVLTEMLRIQSFPTIVMAGPDGKIMLSAGPGDQKGLWHGAFSISGTNIPYQPWARALAAQRVKENATDEARMGDGRMAHGLRGFSVRAGRKDPPPATGGPL